MRFFSSLVLEYSWSTTNDDCLGLGRYLRSVTRWIPLFTTRVSGSDQQVTSPSTSVQRDDVSLVWKFARANSSDICQFSRNRNHSGARHPSGYWSIESKWMQSLYGLAIICGYFRARIVPGKSMFSPRPCRLRSLRVNSRTETIRNCSVPIKKRSVQLSSLVVANARLV